MSFDSLKKRETSFELFKALFLSVCRRRLFGWRERGRERAPEVPRDGEGEAQTV